MKKIKKLILTVVMAILACCTLLFTSACALFDTSVEGTYYFNKLSYTESGITMEIEAGEKFMDMMILEKDFVTITFNEDGTGSMTAVGQTEQITWLKEGEIITMFDSTGEPQTATWSPRKLVISGYEEGIYMTVVLKK